MIAVFFVLQLIATIAAFIFIVIDYLRKYKDMSENIEEIKSKIGSLVREFNNIEMNIK